jgi:hypothetical protein
VAERQLQVGEGEVRCASETKSSRRMVAIASSTRGSSTSQGRTCCSIIAKRAWSKFMDISSVSGQRRGRAQGRQL